MRVLEVFNQKGFIVMSIALQIEELTTKRSNALNKAKDVADQYKGRESEIPEDRLNEMREARLNAIKYKEEMDKLVERQKLVNDIYADVAENNPEKKTSRESEAPNTPQDNFPKWSRFSSSRARQYGVRVPDRLLLDADGDPEKNQVFFDNKTTRGFLDAMGHHFRRSEARTEREKAYYAAADRYSTFRVADVTRGGFAVVPEQMWSGILRTMDDATPTQGLATVMNIEAETFGVRQRISKARMINWGSELSNVSSNREASLRVGKRVLTTKYLTGEFLISNELLGVNGFDVVNFIQEEIGIDTGEFLEDCWLTGDGSGGTPVGLLYAAPVGVGIDTSRDVALGSAVFTVEHLIQMRYKIKGGYARNAVWQMHRDRIADLASLKGSDGHPLWRPSMVAGVPDSLLGSPIVNNENMPNATSSGTYGILYGDHSFYWIAFNGGMMMRVLNELYAETNQTAYIYRMRVDGQPMMAEAFARGKFA